MKGVEGAVSRGSCPGASSSGCLWTLVLYLFYNPHPEPVNHLRDKHFLMKPMLHSDTLSCESTSADKERGRVVLRNFFCLTLGEVMAQIIRDQLLNKPKTHLRQPPNYHYKTKWKVGTSFFVFVCQNVAFMSVKLPFPIVSLSIVVLELLESIEGYLMTAKTSRWLA